MPSGKEGREMEFFEKIGDTITTKGKEAADKAKEMAEVANLKSQISTCEEVIKKNYMEIGRLFMEQYKDAENAPFEKQRTAILNAQAGVEELQQKIRDIKGL
jgi:polyhydroxyalkanoate synthesis regulator phasin